MAAQTPTSNFQHFPQHDQPPYSPGNESNGRPNGNWSDEEESGADDDGTDSKKRKRPMSVSCELCKSRKVKCETARYATRDV